MLPEIKQTDPAAEFDTEERCHIIEVANDDGDEMVSIARARVEPGITTAWHQLDGIDERYVIVTGLGYAELADLEPITVNPGDVVRIPAGCRQRITNIGEQDLIFYAICSPRFRQSAYVNLD